MKTRHLFVLLASAGLGAGALSAGGVSFGLRIGVPAPIVVREAPPRIVEERVPVAPGAAYVWVRGHYTWDRDRWVWVRGAWMMPPQPGAFWVEGKWERRNRQWVEGHWEVPPPPPPPVAVAGPPGPPPGAVEIYADVAPPPPVHEVVVARPGPDYLWINGFYAWDHGRHVWRAGHWERPPHGRAAWVEPRWERRGGRYVFIDGYWR